MTDYRALLVKVLKNLPFTNGGSDGLQFAELGIDGLSEEEIAALEEVLLEINQ